MEIKSIRKCPKRDRWLGCLRCDAPNHLNKCRDGYVAFVFIERIKNKLGSI